MNKKRHFLFLKTIIKHSCSHVTGLLPPTPLFYSLPLPNSSKVAEGQGKWPAVSQTYVSSRVVSCHNNHPGWGQRLGAYSKQSGDLHFLFTDGCSSQLLFRWFNPNLWPYHKVRWRKAMQCITSYLTFQILLDHQLMIVSQVLFKPTEMYLQYKCNWLVMMHPFNCPQYKSISLILNETSDIESNIGEWWQVMREGESLHHFYSKSTHSIRQSGSCISLHGLKKRFDMGHSCCNLLTSLAPSLLAVPLCCRPSSQL